MAIRCFKSLKKTVSISCNSVNIQRDIISTFTPAVSISCLDFASLILVETPGDEKILLLAKFRCFTTDPTVASTIYKFCAYNTGILKVAKLNFASGSRGAFRGLGISLRPKSTICTHCVLLRPDLDATVALFMLTYTQVTLFLEITPQLKCTLSVKKSI